MRLSRGEFEVVFSRHAIKRAVERNIHWDLIERTIFNGKIRRVGDNFIWFSKDFHRGTVLCKAVEAGQGQLLVMTVEWRNYDEKML